jgi:hypothetical protein
MQQTQTMKVVLVRVDRHSGQRIETRRQAGEADGDLDYLVALTHETGEIRLARHTKLVNALAHARRVSKKHGIPFDGQALP